MYFNPVVFGFGPCFQVSRMEWAKLGIYMSILLMALDQVHILSLVSQSVYDQLKYSVKPKNLYCYFELKTKY